MNKKDTAKPAKAPASTSEVEAEITYDSNPFTSAWSGIQKLLHINPHTMIGVAFFNMLLFMVLAITGVILLFAIISLWHQANPKVSFPARLLDLTTFESIGSGMLTAVLVGDLLLLILVAILIQILQAQLAIASARRMSIKFGWLLKESMRHLLPVIGFGALGFLAVTACLMVLSVLFQLMSFAAIAPSFILLCLLVFISLRLAFTLYAIVGENLGPIMALKRSWELTKGHLIESIGSASVAWLVLAVPGVVVSAFARLADGSPGISQVFDLLGVVISVILVVIAAMPLAERYTQLQAVADNKTTPANLSPLNYVALLLVVLVGPLLGSLSRQGGQINPLTPTPGHNTPLEGNFPSRDDQLPTSLQ